ncbi:glycosyltransferase family 4 protein [Denitromonas halophila]|uniref:Glycosyltransferase family 4 protein n=1 Tax=Denitromonas halophila TaxID=1629404 RepID=A0A557QXQ3_9RHOO|nr:glycosyltransferase family 4 protein [Denitromonas halophila]TVO57616.1 glycosyltransferase family 4 protein [Denitromonas halophila]
MSDRNARATPRRVAVVHDWLTVYAGAEKVLEQIFEIWPEADLFSLIDYLPADLRHCVKGKRATTTFIQRLPKATTKYRSYLPLMPMAIEQLDLSAYDLVVSSSHAVAKGVITGPDQLHVSYVHSPIRYAWDLQHQYLAEAGLVKGLKGAIARAILHYIRMWDLRTSNGVDAFVANSGFIARRIYKAYRRDSVVIHPPVDVARFAMRVEKESFYFTASRMVPYKKIPLIVEAFAGMPDKQLIVVGEGPEFEKAKAVATSNVQLLGYQSTEVLIDHMQRARAFVFAAEEDFGITPVEAQACGTPVIAYGKGGALETVRAEGDAAVRTGLFFHEQTVEAIRGAVARFESADNAIRPEACRANAERFSPEHFRVSLKAFVDLEWEKHAADAGRRSCSSSEG